MNSSLMRGASQALSMPVRVRVAAAPTSSTSMAKFLTRFSSTGPDPPRRRNNKMNKSSRGGTAVLLRFPGGDQAKEPEFAFFRYGPLSPTVKDQWYFIPSHLPGSEGRYGKIKESIDLATGLKPPAVSLFRRGGEVSIHKPNYKLIYRTYGWEVNAAVSDELSVDKQSIEEYRWSSISEQNGLPEEEQILTPWARNVLRAVWVDDVFGPELMRLIHDHSAAAGKRLADAESVSDPRDKARAQFEAMHQTIKEVTIEALPLVAQRQDQILGKNDFVSVHAAVLRLMNLVEINGLGTLAPDSDIPYALRVRMDDIIRPLRSVVWMSKETELSGEQVANLQEQIQNSSMAEPREWVGSNPYQ